MRIWSRACAAFRSTDMWFSTVSGEDAVEIVRILSGYQDIESEKFD